MSKTPKVSIVMPTWNRVDLTEKAICSLIDTIENDYINAEIIVVDNGSEDETPLYLSDLKKSGLIQKLVLNKENEGCGKATNKGMALAEGEWIMEVDNDIQMLRGWYDIAMEKFRDIPDLGQLGFLSIQWPYKLYANINIGPPNVAGAWIMPRRFYDEGVRWCEKTWKEEPWQAKLFSKQIQDKGFVTGNLLEPKAIDLAEGNHLKHLEYYQKTFKDRQIEPILKDLIKQEKYAKQKNDKRGKE